MRIPRCPNCNSRVIQKSADGKVRIRTTIVAFGPDGAEVNCKKCGTTVPLDLELGQDLRKALDSAGVPRLVVRKGVDSTESSP